MNNNYVAIMAGGIGSRFWPGSRIAKPKQFLDILGTGKSLLQMTFERFEALVPKEHIFIVTNKIYKALVLEHLPQISENQILLEPSRNNTAPCIAYAAYKIKNLNPKANLVVAPSDHIILKEETFTRVVGEALEFVAKGENIVTIGIEPTRPDTGYGYINYDHDNKVDGLYKVNRFTEKPNLEKAQEFVASGDYVWNAGIFVWNVNTVLNEISQHASGITDILATGDKVYNTDKEQAFIDENYPNTPNISIDYAVMEKSKHIYTIPVDLGWSDLGTWNSLHTVVDTDDNDVACMGDNVLLENVKDSFVRVNSEKLVVIKDIEDYIIIDEDDVLLIWPKSKEQDIKPVTKKLKDLKLEKYL